ncbi:MAG: GNAT family N-acetyltransferase [Syntrophorhabdales bacterium]
MPERNKEAPAINIRKGSEADIEQVSRLWLDMVRELNPSYTPSIEWWKNITLGLMRLYKNYHLFVAEEGQDAVGFLDFMTVPEPATGCAHAVCRHLYVRPERRNSGISNSLLRQFNESAKMDGAVVLEAECGDEQFRFWQRMGFGLVGFKMRKHVRS